MNKTIITLTSVVAVAGAADAQTFATWDVVAPGSNNLSIAGSIDGLGVTVSNDTSSTTADMHNNQTGFGSYIGNAGVTYLPPANADRIYMKLPSASTTSITFASPTTQDLLWHLTAVDGDVTFSSGTFISTYSADGGTVSGLTFTDNLYGSGSGGTGNGSGMSLLISAGTSSFTMNKAYGESFLGTLSTVPEPSSTALLGLGALGLLIRRKR